MKNEKALNLPEIIELAICLAVAYKACAILI
jgi:hypothetical protein